MSNEEKEAFILERVRIAGTAVRQRRWRVASSVLSEVAVYVNRYSREQEEHSRARKHRVREARYVKGIPRISMLAARQLYREAFGHAMPPGWKVRWVTNCKGAGRAQGLCSLDKKMIDLRWDCHETCVATLIHEYVHVRCPTLLHGIEFEAITTAACERVGVENK